MLSRSLIHFIAAFGASAVITFSWLAARGPYTAEDKDVGVNPLTAELRDRARFEPRAVMADTDALPDDVRSSGVVDEVTREWALTNPDDFLAYARSQNRIDNLLAGLVDALLIVPEQVLDISADHPSLPVGAERTLEELAIAAVTERDVPAALEYLEALPSGDRRQRISGAIAEAWARRNPGEAMQWAEGLEPRAPGAIAAVIAATAESDVDRAIRLFEAFEVPARNHPSVRSGVATPEAIARSIVRQITSNSERARIADGLLQSRTARSRIALQELATYWSQVDEPAATEWVALNADRLPSETPVGVIHQLVAKDAVAAASFADQLPADMRVSLAGPIVRGLARRDPFSAARWIEQFQDRSEYAELYAAVVGSLVRSDPAGAAAMLTSIPPAHRLIWPTTGTERRFEGSIAEAWGRKDPAAATAWAQGIVDPVGRASAVNGLVGYWLVSDPKRAQQLVLGLPQDEVRQEALLNLIWRAVTYDHDLEPETVRAHGLDAKQQEAIGELLTTDAELDPLRALSLAGEWISDPDVRRQTIDQIEVYANRYSMTEIISN